MTVIRPSIWWWEAVVALSLPSSSPRWYRREPGARVFWPKAERPGRPSHASGGTKLPACVRAHRIWKIKLQFIGRNDT